MEVKEDDMDVISQLGEENARLTEIALDLRKTLSLVYQQGCIPDELQKQVLESLNNAEQIPIHD